MIFPGQCGYFWSCKILCSVELRCREHFAKELMFDLHIGPHINGIPMHFIKILYCLRTKIRYKIHRTSQEQIKPVRSIIGSIYFKN